MASWACPVCTLHNPMSIAACTVCGNPKPPDAVPVPGNDAIPAVEEEELVDPEFERAKLLWDDIRRDLDAWSPAVKFAVHLPIPTFSDLVIFTRLSTAFPTPSHPSFIHPSSSKSSLHPTFLLNGISNPLTLWKIALDSSHHCAKPKKVPSCIFSSSLQSFEEACDLCIRYLDKREAMAFVHGTLRRAVEVFAKDSRSLLKDTRGCLEHFAPLIGALIERRDAEGAELLQLMIQTGLSKRDYGIFYKYVYSRGVSQLAKALSVFLAQVREHVLPQAEKFLKKQLRIMKQASPDFEENAMQNCLPTLPDSSTPKGEEASPDGGEADGGGKVEEDGEAEGGGGVKEEGEDGGGKGGEGGEGGAEGGEEEEEEEERAASFEHIAGLFRSLSAVAAASMRLELFKVGGAQLHGILVEYAVAMGEATTHLSVKELREADRREHLEKLFSALTAVCGMRHSGLWDARRRLALTLIDTDVLNLCAGGMDMLQSMVRDLDAMAREEESARAAGEDIIPRQTHRDMALWLVGPRLRKEVWGEGVERGDEKEEGDVGKGEEKERRLIDRLIGRIGPRPNPHKAVLERGVTLVQMMASSGVLLPVHAALLVDRARLCGAEERQAYESLVAAVLNSGWTGLALAVVRHVRGIAAQGDLVFAATMASTLAQGLNRPEHADLLPDPIQLELRSLRDRLEDEDVAPPPGSDGITTDPSTLPSASSEVTALLWDVLLHPSGPSLPVAPTGFDELLRFQSGVSKEDDNEEDEDEDEEGEEDVDEGGGEGGGGASLHASSSTSTTSTYERTSSAESTGGGGGGGGGGAAAASGGTVSEEEVAVGQLLSAGTTGSRDAVQNALAHLRARIVRTAVDGTPEIRSSTLEQCVSFLKEASSMHIRRLKASGRTPPEQSGEEHGEGEDDVAVSSTLKPRPAAPRSDAVPRVLDLLLGMVVSLQREPVDRDGLGAGPLHGLDDAPSAVELMVREHDVFAVALAECVAYARTYRSLRAGAMRARLAFLYILLRHCPSLAAGFNVTHLLQLWEGALGRSRLGRKCLFDFLTYVFGGGRWDPFVALQRIDSEFLRDSVLPPPGARAPALAGADVVLKIEGARLSYRTSLSRDTPRVLARGSGVGDELLSVDEARAALTAFFSPESNRFYPDRLGREGVRALLALFVASNAPHSSGSGSVFSTISEETLLCVGDDGVTDPDVLQARVLAAREVRTTSRYSSSSVYGTARTPAAARAADAAAAATAAAAAMKPDPRCPTVAPGSVVVVPNGSYFRSGWLEHIQGIDCLLASVLHAPGPLARQVARFLIAIHVAYAHTYEAPRASFYGAPAPKVPSAHTLVEQLVQDIQRTQVDLMSASTPHSTHQALHRKRERCVQVLANYLEMISPRQEPSHRSGEGEGKGEDDADEYDEASGGGAATGGGGGRGGEKGKDAAKRIPHRVRCGVRIGVETQDLWDGDADATFGSEEDEEEGGGEAGGETGDGEGSAALVRQSSVEEGAEGQGEKVLGPEVVFFVKVLKSGSGTSASRSAEPVMRRNAPKEPVAVDQDTYELLFNLLESSGGGLATSTDESEREQKLRMRIWQILMELPTAPTIDALLVDPSAVDWPKQLADGGWRALYLLQAISAWTSDTQGNSDEPEEVEETDAASSSGGGGRGEGDGDGEISSSIPSSPSSSWVSTFATCGGLGAVAALLAEMGKYDAWLRAALSSACLGILRRCSHFLNDSVIGAAAGDHSSSSPGATPSLQKGEEVLATQLIRVVGDGVKDGPMGASKDALDLLRSLLARAYRRDEASADAGRPLGERVLVEDEEAAGALARVLAATSAPSSLRHGVWRLLTEDPSTGTPAARAAVWKHQLSSLASLAPTADTGTGELLETLARLAALGAGGDKGPAALAICLVRLVLTWAKSSIDDEEDAAVHVEESGVDDTSAGAGAAGGSPPAPSMGGGLGSGSGTTSGGGMMMSSGDAAALAKPKSKPLLVAVLRALGHMVLDQENVLDLVAECSEPDILEGLKASSGLPLRDVLVELIFREVLFTEDCDEESLVSGKGAVGGDTDEESAARAVVRWPLCRSPEEREAGFGLLHALAVVTLGIAAGSSGLQRSESDASTSSTASKRAKDSVSVQALATGKSAAEEEASRNIAFATKLSPEQLHWLESVMLRLRTHSCGTGPSLVGEKWGFSLHGQVRSGTGYVGLVNLGATCYANAILQQFFMAPAVRTAILEAKIDVPVLKESEKARLKRLADRKAERERQRVARQLQREAERKELEQRAKEAKIRKDENEILDVSRELAEAAKGKDDDAVEEEEEDPVPLETRAKWERWVRERRVIAELQRLFSFLRSSEAMAHNPVQAIDSFRVLNLFHDVRQQNDASELYTSLLGFVRERLYDPVEGDLGAARNFDHATGLLEGSFTHRVGCCGHVDESDPLRAPFVSVPVGPGKPDLRKSLSAWCDPEQLDEVSCPHCKGRKSSAHKSSYVARLPEVLTLHLRRFEFDTATLEARKVNDRCAFPMELDMTPYTRWGRVRAAKRRLARRQAKAAGEDPVSSSLASAGARGGEGKGEDGDDDEPLEARDLYRLVGVVVHSGSKDGGHYWSLGRDRRPGMEDKWLKMDDMRVTQFDPKRMADEAYGGTRRVRRYESRYSYHATWVDEPVEHNALMLVYERVSASPAALAADKEAGEILEREAVDAARKARKRAAEEEAAGDEDASDPNQVRCPPTHSLQSSTEEIARGRRELIANNLGQAQLAHRFDPKLADFLAQMASRCPRSAAPIVGSVTATHVFDTALRCTSLGDSSARLLGGLVGLMQRHPTTARVILARLCAPAGRDIATITPKENLLLAAESASSSSSDEPGAIARERLDTWAHEQLEVLSAPLIPKSGKDDTSGRDGTSDEASGASSAGTASPSAPGKSTLKSDSTTAIPSPHYTDRARLEAAFFVQGLGVCPNKGNRRLLAALWAAAMRSAAGATATSATHSSEVRALREELTMYGEARALARVADQLARRAKQFGRSAEQAAERASRSAPRYDEDDEETFDSAASTQGKLLATMLKSIGDERAMRERDCAAHGLDPADVLDNIESDRFCPKPDDDEAILAGAKKAERLVATRKEERDRHEQSTPFPEILRLCRDIVSSRRKQQEALRKAATIRSERGAAVQEAEQFQARHIAARAAYTVAASAAADAMAAALRPRSLAGLAIRMFVSALTLDFGAIAMRRWRHLPEWLVALDAVLDAPQRWPTAPGSVTLWKQPAWHYPSPEAGKTVADVLRRAAVAEANVQKEGDASRSDSAALEEGGDGGGGGGGGGAIGDGSGVSGLSRSTSEVIAEESIEDICARMGVYPAPGSPQWLGESLAAGAVADMVTSTEEDNDGGLGSGGVEEEEGKESDDCGDGDDIAAEKVAATLNGTKLLPMSDLARLAVASGLIGGLARVYNKHQKTVLGTALDDKPDWKGLLRSLKRATPLLPFADTETLDRMELGRDAPRAWLAPLLQLHYYDQVYTDLGIGIKELVHEWLIRSRRGVLEALRRGAMPVNAIRNPEPDDPDAGGWLRSGPVPDTVVADDWLGGRGDALASLSRGAAYLAVVGNMSRPIELGVHPLAPTPPPPGISFEESEEEWRLATPWSTLRRTVYRALRVESPGEGDMIVLFNLLTGAHRARQRLIGAALARHLPAPLPENPYEPTVLASSSKKKKRKEVRPRDAPPRPTPKRGPDWMEALGFEREPSLGAMEVPMTRHSSTSWNFHGTSRHGAGTGGAAGGAAGGEDEWLPKESAMEMFARILRVATAHDCPEAASTGDVGVPHSALRAGLGTTAALQAWGPHTSILLPRRNNEANTAGFQPHAPLGSENYDRNLWVRTVPTRLMLFNVGDWNRVNTDPASHCAWLYKTWVAMSRHAYANRAADARLSWLRTKFDQRSSAIADAGGAAELAKTVGGSGGGGGEAMGGGGVVRLLHDPIELLSSKDPTDYLVRRESPLKHTYKEAYADQDNLSRPLLLRPVPRSQIQHYSLMEMEQIWSWINPDDPGSEADAGDGGAGDIDVGRRGRRAKRGEWKSPRHYTPHPLGARPKETQHGAPLSLELPRGWREHLRSGATEMPPKEERHGDDIPRPPGMREDAEFYREKYHPAWDYEISSGDAPITWVAPGIIRVDRGDLMVLRLRGGQHPEVNGTFVEDPSARAKKVGDMAPLVFVRMVGSVRWTLMRANAHLWVLVRRLRDNTFIGRTNDWFGYEISSRERLLVPPLRQRFQAARCDNKAGFFDVWARLQAPYAEYVGGRSVDDVVAAAIRYREAKAEAASGIERPLDRFQIRLDFRPVTTAPWVDPIEDVQRLYVLLRTENRTVYPSKAEEELQDMDDVELRDIVYKAVKERAEFEANLRRHDPAGVEDDLMGATGLDGDEADDEDDVVTHRQRREAHGTHEREMTDMSGGAGGGGGSGGGVDHEDSGGIGSLRSTGDAPLEGQSSTDTTGLGRDIRGDDDVDGGVGGVNPWDTHDDNAPITPSNGGGVRRRRPDADDDEVDRTPKRRMDEPAPSRAATPPPPPLDTDDNIGMVKALLTDESGNPKASDEEIIEELRKCADVNEAVENLLIRFP